MVFLLHSIPMEQQSTLNIKNVLASVEHKSQCFEESYAIQDERKADFK